MYPETYSFALNKKETLQMKKKNWVKFKWKIQVKKKTLPRRIMLNYLNEFINWKKTEIDKNESFLIQGLWRFSIWALKIKWPFASLGRQSGC